MLNFWQNSIGIQIALILFINTITSSISNAETISQTLRERVESFYRVLLDKDIRSYAIREEISDYFLEKKHLDEFIVNTLIQMKTRGIRDFRIRSFAINDINLSEGEARVQVKLKGYYLLSFKRTFFQTNIWDLHRTETGQEVWYLIPLPLEAQSP